MSAAGPKRPESKLDELAKEIDDRFEILFTHPLFLRAAGGILNFNSYRKIVTNQLLTLAWKTLQLPTKRDQERGLHLMNELYHRISELEEKLERQETKSMPAASASISPRPRKTKPKTSPMAVQ